MPHIIPNDPWSGYPGARAEKTFLRALREELPEEWWVYCNLPYYDLQSPRIKCGEIDFLLLHPERGMLFVECKGEGVIFEAGSGEWHRTLSGRDENGNPKLERLKESPVRQADRGRYDFVAMIERAALSRFPQWTNLPFVHAHAVAFPLAPRLQVELPTDFPKELCFTAADRGRVLSKVEFILGSRRRSLGWSQPAVPDGQFRTFRKHVLRPSFRLAPGLGAQIQDDEQTFVRLSEEQVGVVEGWLENPVLRVRGGAGTGKTVLALEAARSRASIGERVLLLCYNRFLASELGRWSEGWGLEGGSVRAAHFHGLCEEAARRLGRPFEVPSSTPEEVTRFWNDTAPEILWDALLERRLGPFDTIVVDEAQDFCTHWWTVLESAFEDGPGPAGRWVFFYDPAQDIFNRRTELPPGASLTLKANYRNTRRITETLNRLSVSPVESHPACPLGTAPEIRAQGSGKEARRAVEELVRSLVKDEGLLPDHITILTPRRVSFSSLADTIESASIGGERLSIDPDDRAGALLMCNVHAFKGLEADVVILIDVAPRYAHSSRMVRYVASSRAKHLLHVLCDGDFFG